MLNCCAKFFFEVITMAAGSGHPKAESLSHCIMHQNVGKNVK